MLEISHVTYGYNKQRRVFENFSLSLSGGGIYGLLGKNGTGKSTLLYLIMGLLRPQQGAVTLDGADTCGRCPETLREMFIVPEEYDLPDIRLREYVKVIRPFYPHFSDELLFRCLEDFGMKSDCRLGELSMGQKKKIYMSMALAAQTRLLLMDEPTNGLDIPSKSQFRRVVARSMRDDQLILISTHQVRDVELLLDHVCVIDGSRQLLNAGMADIAAHWSFVEVARDSLPADAVYSEPSYNGYQAIVPNTGGEETPVNLELLFNALSAGIRLLP